MEKLIQLKNSLSATQIFLITGISLLIYVLFWSLFAIIKKRADLADIAWGLGFVWIAGISFLLSPFSVYSLIVNLLVTAWAFRLARHIYLRNKNRQEDFRYQNLKLKWGKYFSLHILVQVFILQGALLYVIALPILWININSQKILSEAFWIALPIWLIGFLIETIGDYQLQIFKLNPSNQGKLLRTGLWSYVRHPNYLGEITQWWAIWMIALFISYGWILVISPLLITFLIVKVSGIPLLEEKLKHHPDFLQYSANTPALIPFPLLNGLLYSVTWLIIVYYGSIGSISIPLITFILNYGIQFYLFQKFDFKSFLISLPLSIYALLMGLFQETIFIHFSFLSYPNQGLFPPFWLLFLYPLFSLTLNSSLQFLNKNLTLCFFLGGLGSLLSYLSGEKLGGVYFLSPLSYPLVFTIWGIYLIILIFLNQKLIIIEKRYTDLKRINEPLTVFFDMNCPICSREVEWLKKREKTGSINYAYLQSDEELKKITNAFSYQEGMEKIHAIDADGKILTGIDVLTEVYARVGLPMLAILLQAPIFHPLFKIGYSIWAKYRFNPTH